MVNVRKIFLCFKENVVMIRRLIPVRVVEMEYVRTFTGKMVCHLMDNNYRAKNS